MTKARAHIIVEGLVQGVFFRASAVEAARRLGATGWVKNNPDGTVEAIAEGERAHVEEFIRWCRKGPPMARVDNIIVRWEEFKSEFDDFNALTRHNSY